MKIKIKEPCDADWNKMKIGMISRHCELCVKNVMDFTKMSREEILIYLFKNNNKSTCARMYGGQMDFHHQELEAIIEGTRKQKGNLPFVVMSLAALALLSCDSNPIMGEIENIPRSEIIKELDSIEQAKQDSLRQIEMGGMAFEQPLKPTCLPKSGEIEMMTGEIIEVLSPDPVKMGKMIAIPQPPAENTMREQEIMGNLAPPEIEIGKIIKPTHQEKIYEIVEIMPEFVGGMDSLMSYLSKNIKYPKKAQNKGIEGRVFVQFIVEKNGSIKAAEVIKGIDKSLDKEALRVISSMPNWLPGKNNGELVRTKFVIPVKYQLK
ncbi:MAG: energy transducer TonB [Flavobacteriales bacterium]